jgi:hypothetical protein
MLQWKRYWANDSAWSWYATSEQTTGETGSNTKLCWVIEVNDEGMFGLTLIPDNSLLPQKTRDYISTTKFQAFAVPSSIANRIENEMRQSKQ